MKVVVDTNVFVSGLINPNGTPAQILNLLLNERIQLLYDNRILQEYIEVLGRTKFGFKQEWIDPLIEYVRTEGEFIIPEATTQAFADVDDKKFYEIAISGDAEYLITGNKSHFPKNNKIKSPKEFMDIYKSEREKK